MCIFDKRRVKSEKNWKRLIKEKDAISANSKEKTIKIC